MSLLSMRAGFKDTDLLKAPYYAFMMIVQPQHAICQ